jgi:hypothetical protein
VLKDRSVDGVSVVSATKSAAAPTMMLDDVPRLYAIYSPLSVKIDIKFLAFVSSTQL